MLNRLKNFFRLPSIEEVEREMQPKRKFTPLESFKASLYWSIYEQISGRTLRQIDGGEWLCNAPRWDLFNEDTGEFEASPLLLDILIDLELNPPEWTRIWFELEFVRLNRVDDVLIYRASCDRIL
jgi:hypothetical protein